MSEVSRIRAALDLQRQMAWALLELHLTDLSDEECFWRPASLGPHVIADSGLWHAEWPETEDYAAGPPSIAWLTWHVGFWWSSVLNHSFGDQTLKREEVDWPGSASKVREWIVGLHEEWVAKLADLSDDEFVSSTRARWPFNGKPFYQIVSWLNLELMKNASELGYCRFLYAVRQIPEA